MRPCFTVSERLLILQLYPSFMDNLLIRGNRWRISSFVLLVSSLLL